MTRPAFGLCLPVEFHRAIDGDTIEVGIAESRWAWRIRLIDCWCPEMSTQEGREAQQYAEKIMACCEHPAVHIPMPHDCHNLLSQITFDRIPGHIYVTKDRTLNTMLVAAGHATKTKPRKTKGAA